MAGASTKCCHITGNSKPTIRVIGLLRRRSTITTSFTSLATVQSEFLGAEEYTQVLVADYAKDHPHADIAGRDLLIAHQTADPKKPVSRIVFVGSDCNTSKTHTASKNISMFRAR
jgi:hypothetical protein